MTCECVGGVDGVVNFTDVDGMLKKFQKLKLEKQTWFSQIAYNATSANDTAVSTVGFVDLTEVPLKYCSGFKGHLTGTSCYFIYDVFLMSVVLTFGTFALAMTFKFCRNSGYFPAKVTRKKRNRNRARHPRR